MIVVKAQPGESTDALIRKFTKKVVMSQLLKDVRRREFYQKPSQLRKEKAKIIARRQYAQKHSKGY